MKFLALIFAALLAMPAAAQNFSAVLHPIPEAPTLTQQAQALFDDAMKRVPQIDTAGLAAQLKAQPETMVIDVRQPVELATLGGCIDSPRFANILRGWLEFQIEQAVPDKDAPIVVY